MKCGEDSDLWLMFRNEATGAGLELERVVPVCGIVVLEAGTFSITSWLAVIESLIGGWPALQSSSAPDWTNV